MKHKFFLLLPMITLFANLAGCAAQPVKTPEQALTERVNKYWTAVKLRDIATLYPLEADSVDGSLTAADAKKKYNSKTAVLGYKIRNITIDGENALVALDTENLLPQFHKPFTHIIMDRWVLIDGEWYHKLAPPFWLQQRSGGGK